MEENIPLEMGMLNPSMDEIPVEEDDLIAHMDKKEIEMLSSIQPSGIVRNNPWKIPELHELWDMIQSQPEVKEEVRGTIQEHIMSDSGEKDHLAAADKKELHQKPQKLHNELFGESRVAEAIGHQGTNGDNEIVLMRKGLLTFLWDSVPPGYEKKYINVNEHTGFPEFGLWSGILGGLGAVVGSVVPGIGTMLGASIGSGAGALGEHVFSSNDKKPERNASPENPNDYYMDDEDEEEDTANRANYDSLIDSGATVINSLLGGKKDTENPYVGAGKKLLKSMFGSEEPEQKLNRANSIDRSNMAKYYKKLEEATREKREFNTGLYTDFMARYHPKSKKINASLVHAPEKNEKVFPQSPNQYKEGGEVIRHIKPIRKSLYLKGDESGQADNIYVKVPEHTFIIDAQTVSLIGDGNSENGKLRLDEMIKQIPSFKVENLRDVDCALAAGEYAITPDKVAGYGNGDIRKGIEILKSFVKEIKKYKKLEVKTIPKPTKNLFAYLKKKIMIGLKNDA